MKNQDLVSIEDIAEDLALGGPLLDVRSPKEFLHGAVPSATNLPILQDDERTLVGTCYKRSGSKAAVHLGHSLVCGGVRELRLKQWKSFIEQSHCPALYCARGGLRSQIACEWLSAEGVNIPRVIGGYKSIRQYLMKQLSALPGILPLLILAGRTGTGKTALLGELRESLSVIDLEVMAEHRGSAFGGTKKSQPSQAGFENQLACELMKVQMSNNQWTLLEDESRTIGARVIPETLYRNMQAAPVVILESSFESRIERIKHQYVLPLVSDEDPSFEKLRLFLFGSLRRIEKKLGNERYVHVQNVMSEAIICHERTGDSTCHDEWVSILLRHYYDPLYDRHLEKVSGRVVYRGDASEISDFLQHQRERSPKIMALPVLRS